MPFQKGAAWRGKNGRRSIRGGRPGANDNESRTPTPSRDSEQEDTSEIQNPDTPLPADEVGEAEGDANNEYGEDDGEDGEEDEDADGTPKKRLARAAKIATPSRTDSEAPAAKKKVTGFRGGTAWRGKNWRPKGPNSGQTQHPIDYDGNPGIIENDEVVLPKDAEGEKKVDDMGNLADGREYRVRTFMIDGRGNRLYMLSTEPARCIGFRDSYLFFQKHRQLAKIVLSEEEKHGLIDRRIIPHSYKGRNIGVVTARSVYREFGSRIVIGGRKIIDDYNVTAAREAGDVEGELAVPEDIIPHDGSEYDRKRYVAWHGASAVYHSSAPAIGGVLQPTQASIIHQGGPPVKRRKIHVTGSNWMLEHARAASNFNSLLTSLRSANKNGQYDIYTNTKHYPSIYLHSHAKWEAIPSSTSPFPPTPASPASYPELTPYLKRNAVTVDTLFAEPPTSTLGIPGPAGVDAWGLGSKGLVDVDEDIIGLLDENCKSAFLKAREQEVEWKSTWGVEGVDGARREGIRRGV